MLTSCGSAKLVSQWQGSEDGITPPSKVLLIGMTPRTDVRRNFEESLADGLEQEGWVTARSIDFFEASFQKSEASDTELNAIESKLISSGFDGVLITRLVGAQERATFPAEQFVGHLHEDFKEEYLHHQDLYKLGPKETYTIFQIESSLYCLCPEKERELFWRGIIELTETDNQSEAIRALTKRLIQSLKAAKIFP